VSTFFRLLKGEAVRALIGYETISNLALITMAIALGTSLRLQRLRARQQDVIIRLNDERAGARAQLQVQSERQRISRDLHDTVGHTMSVISLHAGVAAEAVGVDDRAAAEAIERVRDACRRTITELRRTLRLLQDDRASTDEMTLARLDDLIEPLRQAGITVHRSLDLDLTALSRAADLTGFRVVQESVTNIIRHAGAHQATVEIGIVGPMLHISITDDGRGPTGHDHRAETDAPGQGLIGMRERVRCLGGTVTTGRTRSGGFAVTAEIPREAQP
jgi:signal transduction histidine kinase